MTASRRAIAHVHAAAKDAGIGDTSKEIHDRLHGWAVAEGYNSLTDMPDDALDAMARRIKADPEIMAAWFDAYAPMEWEQMDPAENAEPGDPSTLAQLYPADWLAELNAECDRIQSAKRWTQ